MSNKIGYERVYFQVVSRNERLYAEIHEEKDLALFVNLAGISKPKNESEIPLRVVVPAFAISELKRAFQIGFLLYIPFFGN